MNKTKAIEQAIRTACPELVELTRGCEILIEGCTETTNFICEEERKGGKVWCISDGDSYGVCPKPSYVRVIGHPIHLDSARMIIPVEKWGELINMWEMGDLSKQDESTIDFLFQHKI